MTKCYECLEEGADHEWPMFLEDVFGNYHETVTMVCSKCARVLRDPILAKDSWENLRSSIPSGVDYDR